MKRIFLVMTAALMAVGFSSFKTVTVDNFFYLDDSAQWQQVPSYIDVPTVCPADNILQCQIFLDGALRQIVDANHNPWMTRIH